MDPLSRGGEDSLRNVVYCCSSCNSKKKNKLFTQWLSELPVAFRIRCRQIYEFKHQHSPEAFVSEGSESRTEGTPLFLQMDELEFQRDFLGMLPLEPEPPSQYLLDLIQPHEGPVDVESLFIPDSQS